MALAFIRSWLTLNLPKLRAASPDALWFVGLALVAYGVGMIALPAGVIVAGLALCFTGYAAAGDDS